MSPAVRVFRVEASVTERPACVSPVTATPPRSMASWLAGATVIATAVAVDPAGMRPFTSLRWFLVSTMVAITASTVVRARRPGAASVRVPAWFAVAWSVLVGSMVLAASVVGEPVTAWLGHPQRHLGVLAWVVFGAAALCGTALAATAGAHRRLSLAAAVAAGVTGATAVADLAGWSPLGTSFDGGRIGGLLGQPTTLGAFAVLLLPLAATAPISPRLRLLATGGLAVALIGSQTRGAIVGLLAVGLVSLPVLRSTLRRRHLLWLVLGVAVLLAATPVGGRLLSSAESGRLDDWRLAVDVISERPLLGTGPEGYRIAVVGSLDHDYVEEHGRDVVIDRAHSAPLDVAATGGVAAGLAYLVLVGGVAVSTWRLQRRSPWSVPAAAGAGALGYLVAGLLAFPTAEVDAVVWLLAGFAVAAAWPASATAEGPTHRVARRLATPAAAILLFVAFSAGATDVAADRWLAGASDQAAAGRIDDAVATADRATGLRPDLVDAWYVAATVAASGPTILDLDRGIDRVRAGLSRSPDDPALRQLHAELAAERYLRSGLRTDRNVAVSVLDALLDDDPTNEAAADLRSAVLDVSPSTPAEPEP